MLRRRMRAGLGVMLASAMVLAACGSDSDSAGNGNSSGDSPTTTAGGSGNGGATSIPDAQAGDPVHGGSLVISHVSNPSSLDPISGGSGNDHVSLYPFYDRLINFDPQTLEAVPGLARSWEYPDPQTLVLNLEEGVQFHDGTDFNAEAVKFSIDRALTLETSTVKSDLAMVESVEVLDEFTVQINMNRDDASLLLILADRPGMVVSPAAVGAAGEDFGRQPVGTGPFTFVEWLPNDRLVMTKNSSYWQEGLPYLDDLTIRYIADQQTAVNALMAGETDMAMKVQPPDVETLESNSDLTISNTPSLALDMCYLNYSKEPFSSQQARMAANLAMNREALNQAYVFGMGLPAHQVYPPGYWAADPSRDDFFAYDPDQARALLEEAGFGDGVEIRGMAYDASGQARKTEIIQAQLAEVGLNMTFDIMEVGAATSTFFESLEYDIYCAGWSGRPDPSQTALSLFGTTAFYNAGDYEPPGMVAALDAAGAASDPTERAAAFHEVVRISQDDALGIPLLHQSDINAYASSVGGFVPNLYGKIDLSFLWDNG